MRMIFLLSLFILSSSLLSLQKRSSADKAISTVDLLTQQILQEQKVHDTAFYAQLKQCESEIKYREKELGGAKYAYSRAVAEHDTCQNEKDQISSKDSKFKSAGFFLKNSLGSLKGLQGLEQGFNLSKLRLYDSILNSVQNFKESSSKSAFVQLSNNVLLSENDEVLENFLEISLNDLKHNQLNLEKVEKAASEARKERQSIMNDIDRHYGKLFGIVENVMSGYEGSIERNNELLSAIQECITKQEYLKFVSYDLEYRSKNLLRDIGVLCKDWKDQYDQLSQERKTEISLLQSLKLITSQRFK